MTSMARLVLPSKTLPFSRKSLLGLISTAPVIAHFHVTFLNKLCFCDGVWMSNICFKNRESLKKLCYCIHYGLSNICFWETILGFMLLTSYPRCMKRVLTLRSQSFSSSKTRLQCVYSSLLV